jgi:hypothetical protein
VAEPTANWNKEENRATVWLNEQNNKLKKNKYTGPLDCSEAFPMKI